MAIRCTVLKVDGTTSEHVFDGDEPPLEFMQEACGGFVEHVKVAGYAIVIVNEDAMMLDMPVNELAMQKLGDVPGSIDGKLRGDVVLVEHVN